MLSSCSNQLATSSSRSIRTDRSTWRAASSARRLSASSASCSKYLATAGASDGRDGKSARLTTSRSKATKDVPSAHEAAPPFTPLASLLVYLCERCVSSVRYAPISRATWSASARVEWRFARASAASSSPNVASCIRSVAPRPALASAAHGRVSPEYTMRQPRRWVSTTPQASGQCSTGTLCTAAAPSELERSSHCLSMHCGALKRAQLTKRRRGHGGGGSSAK
mmetsp:Transcript_47293/g.109771  ORF Transcript_47293/g.109771 Transcript_47293/m.109771 type:complete len:224 (+) Transcript_47293:458-1129(+)